MIYDIFYVSKEKINDVDWQQFRSRFPSAQKIENITSMDDVKKRAFTKFFWLVWDDVVISKDFNFDYRVDKWDEEYVHVFKNGEIFDGVMLIGKHHSLTEKEFKYRFPINRKECNVLASTPRPFEIFYIDTYEQYTEALSTSKTDMFWVVRDDIVISNDFKFTDYYVPVYDQFHRNITHTFKNNEWYDGISLYSKNTPITEKEFKYRFPIEKKECNIVASNPKPYDVVFISYNEPNADKNFENLKLKRPDAKRVHGVKGIHNAHLEAAKLATTEMFWVVDADAELVDDFNFEIEYFPHYDAGNRLEQTTAVYVWSSQNPINDLVYGYGGVKLLPTKLTLEMNLDSVDMTTSISKKFKVINKVSNITAFNTDEFSTWRSAFRECVKLTSKVIDKDYQVETEDRLRRWCRTGADRQFGEYALGGARLGYRYGMKYISNKEMLAKINDFDWIKEIYQKWEESYLKWKSRDAG